MSRPRHDGHRNSTATPPTSTRGKYIQPAIRKHRNALDGNETGPTGPTGHVPHDEAGDFNLHHPDWEEVTTEPPATARAMAEWLQDKSFSLLNVHNYPNLHHHNHLHHSVCDLPLANKRAIGRTLASQWKVDEEAHTGSDHVVIRFTIVNDRIAKAKQSQNA